MFDVIVEVLEELAAAISPTILGPDGGVDAFVPTIADLRAQLPDVPARTALINAYLAEVHTNWDPLDAAGVIAKLERARGVHSSVNHLNGVSTSGFRFETLLEEYLLVDNRNQRDLMKEESVKTITGYRLMKGDLSVSDVTDTTDHAVDAVMDLRRLNDVLLRVRIAQKAFSDLGIPIEQVLAIYRVEGNLNVMPSLASINLKIPSGTKDYPTHTSLDKLPDIGRLIQVFARSKMGMFSDPQILDFALLVWLVQIGGLDVVGKMGALPPPLRDHFIDWSGSNWQKAGFPAPPGKTHPQAAAQRWDAMIAQLALQRITSGADEIWVVNVKDPLQFVAMILEEELVFQKRLAQIDSFISTVPPALAGKTLDPVMSYLHYHGIASEQFKPILARAIVAASRTTGSRYRPLRSAISNDADFQKQMPVLRLMESQPEDIASKLALTVWLGVEAWLVKANHLDLLIDFLGTFGIVQPWKSWGELRVNMSRYRVLLSYYQNLMA